MNLVGVLNNTGANLVLGSAGVWVLNGGTITGGTITASDSRTYLQSLQGTLDGVTLDTNLIVNTWGTLTIRNGLTLTLGGTVTVNDPGYQAYTTTLDFKGTQHLSGNGQVLLGGKGARLCA